MNQATHATENSWQSDPTQSQVGVHVLSDFGKHHRLASTLVTGNAIHDALHSVDWAGGFHQVVVVTCPGVSMEVGGSLDPEHGLSAMYRNQLEREEGVIEEPPASVEGMEEILRAFIRGDHAWREEYAFDFEQI